MSDLLENVLTLIGVVHIGWKFIFKSGFIIEPGFGIGFYGDKKIKPDFVSRLSLEWAF